MTDQKHLPLTPITHSWIDQLLAQPSTLQQAISQYQSPVNIQSLVPFEENIQTYHSVFNKYGLKHRIYFARKANKCVTFAKHAASVGQGVDTASYEELKQCLDAGIEAEFLISTAAVKTQRLFELAVKNEVQIIVDNLDELALLEQVCKALDKQATISLRVGGFEIDGARMHSRFGFSIEEAGKLVLHKLAEHQYLLYTGLHFHLNGYSVPERALAIGQCIHLIDTLKSNGVDTLHLDIGGGILIKYLDDKVEWEQFQTELKRAALGERSALTYLNDPLGMVKIDGVLHGEPKVYPYYNELYKERFLEGILTSQVSGFSEPIHQLLVDRDIELRIEPGRSLLDQTGITVARVAFRKHDSAGNLLVGLEMNRTQMKSSSADFLLDPFHIPLSDTMPEDTSADNDSDSGEKVYGYLVGAYCLEQELILVRQIEFNQMPAVGDLMVFVNTAGYMMHFFESQAHQFALAQNVFLGAEGDFKLDS